MTGKTLRISGKCSDCAYASLLDENDDVMIDNDGYVPIIKGLGGEDYIDFEIDIETGQILNWVRPTDEEMIEAIAGM